jgi:hypothetical protein
MTLCFDNNVWTLIYKVDGDDITLTFPTLEEAKLECMNLRLPLNFDNTGSDS